MKLYYTLRNKLGLLFVPVAVLAMVSCGSYQYSGYEADGIYGESRPGIWEQQDQQVNEVRPNNENSYYKDLFAQQSQMVGEVLESDIFTDVDSYSSNNGYDNYSEVGGDVAYVGGNAPWGEDPDTYTVNIINRGGFYGGFYDGFYGAYYSPWRFGYGYRYPFYGGGWFDPYWPGNWGGFGPYAYGAPGWNIGFGINFGYNFGYGYGGYYNPYYPYFYNNYYHNNYYNNRYAYNTGRRNSRAYGEGPSRRNSYSDRIRSIRNSDYGTSRVRNSVRNSDSRVYTRTSRRSEPVRSYDNSRSRSSSPVYSRSSRSSSNGTYRSSSSRRSTSSSRSTTTRSSSSSSRSSGTTRSSGGRSSSSRGGRGGGQ
ncbi:hypothetical protein [Christiangramia sp. SM2212]|uniref:Vitellogenin II n=1 Tax=Christiangramia sediminicola TaxID=3073267 RepID=A0ABU1ETY5_9FLAO|nr:hypothetical protein [Christiangramia sp. SM2212]MDR5591844.1 hypothetical protein [Christiangramia sp. SM2212]